MNDLQAMRKVTGSLSKSQCTVVFLNQLRSKIGVIYGSPDVTSGELLGCLRFTKFCWVGKHVNIIMKPTNIIMKPTNIIMKPTNSLTQGQPNPKKNIA